MIDPLSTKRIEAPIAELRRRYTIVIVTQQAVRVSQRTALFHMGEMLMVGPTEQIVTQPCKASTRDHVSCRSG